MTRPGGVARRPYRLHSLTLNTGEELPVLVRTRTGTPPRLPLRWVVRTRRWEASPNTIRSQLYGAAEFYEWGAEVWGSEAEFEDFLARGGQLTPAHLQALLTALRARKVRWMGKDGEQKSRPRSAATVAHRARAIRAFLRWTADPLDRGTSLPVDAASLTLYRQRLDENFRSLLSKGASSTRLRPLTQKQDEFLRRIILPVRGPGGRFRTPIRFSDENPFRHDTAVRNWLVYQFEREYGLRRGETLKVTVEDTPGRGRDYLAVRRRPNDPHDSRSIRPAVKRGERALPVSPGLRLGLRVYQTDLRHKGRRVPGGHPYLLTSSRDGAPLSVSGHDEIWRQVQRKYTDRFDRLSAHRLRHTWAEDLAQHLLRQNPDEEAALATLRSAGGWNRKSNVPFHYVQLALQAKANDALRERFRSLYDS